MPTASENKGETPPYRCILWGGYAWGNVGDELTLAVALKDMKRRFGDSVAVLTRSPGYTRRLFPDSVVIPYEPVYRPVGFGDPLSFYDVEDQLTSTVWGKHIASCESLYLVGGGYLTDIFLLDWVLAPVFVAKHCGAEIATAPIGLGPFYSEGWAKRVAEAFRVADVVVRDDASLEYCRQYGVPAVRQDDDGHRLSEVLRPPAADKHRQPRPWRIGVNCFCQYGSIRHAESNAWWTELLKHLSQENTVVEGFCFHNSICDDFAITSECFANAGLDPSLVRVPDFDFREACARLANFDAVVSSRFHAVVVGNAFNIHTYAVCDGDYYSRKMEAATKKLIRSTLVRQFDSTPEETAASILKRLRYLSSDRSAA